MVSAIRMKWGRGASKTVVVVEQEQLHSLKRGP